jgi:methylated-DNA-[protein]-cysteine S-methyltransferase
MGAVALLCRAPSLGESVARRSIWKDHIVNTESITEAELLSAVMDTPIGPIRIVASDDGVRAILLSGEDAGRVPMSVPSPDADHPVVVATIAQLTEYFDGEREEFDLPLDPIGTDFQQSAWKALRTIPYGTTVSYGEQAARMGDRRKARAVGAANGRNPISIVVPCHRVVGSNGSLTGYAGGIDTKAWLLDHERGLL